MPNSFSRKRAFEGIRNFRDFGGYRGHAGRMARGRFFRSAHYAHASDEDLDHLAGMGIGAVVDLRRPEERTRMPSRRWTDFNAELIENHDDDEGAGKESWHGFMEDWDLSTEGVRDYHRRYYERAPTLPRLHDLYARYFRAVAGSDGPIVVHCAAGKDRTGLIVALTHLVAGVHRDDIVADYLMTNDPESFAIHAPVWAEEIARQRGRAPDLDTMHVLMGVEAEYLDRAFGVIATAYGGVESYLRDTLGIDPALRARIERRLFD